MRALVAGLVGLQTMDDPRIDAVVHEVDAHLAATSPVLRTGLVIVLDVLRALPLFVLGRLALLEHLAPTDRARFLERLDRSPRLSLPLVAYKTLVTIAFYELPGELENIGYGSERRRWTARIEAGS